jgi:hypothetical protein
MKTKNYKIKLTVTDPDTDKNLNASMNLNLIQDFKAINGIGMLDQMLHALVDEFENAVDTDEKV